MTPMATAKQARPDDDRPPARDRVWARVDARCGQDERQPHGRLRGGRRGREVTGAAREAAHAAGQAAAVPHVAAHELGAAAYAIRAVRAAAGQAEAGRLECSWQRDRLHSEIRKLVLDDQRLRNDLCWSVFEC
jgi:hypothetical protein